MGKRTQVKAQQKPEPSVGKEHDLIPVRPSRGPLQRVPKPIEATVPQSPTAGSVSPRHEQIAVRAYQLWEAHGRLAGTDSEDWFEAERLLRAETP